MMKWLAHIEGRKEIKIKKAYFCCYFFVVGIFVTFFCLFVCLVLDFFRFAFRNKMKGEK